MNRRFENAKKILLSEINRMVDDIAKGIIEESNQGRTEADECVQACQAAVSYFGETPQKIQAIEELSELQTVIAKDINDRDVYREDIIDEIADVQIIIWQMMIIYDEKRVIAQIKQKVERLKELMRES